MSLGVARDFRIEDPNPKLSGSGVSRQVQKNWAIVRISLNEYGSQNSADYLGCPLQPAEQMMQLVWDSRNIFPQPGSLLGFLLSVEERR